ncbi:MAG: aspartate aminotransferase family protein [Chloroflexi bacterium]|nr:aspartate aminotransferase family protein [Chloroflexota bacterium]
MRLWQTHVLEDITLVRGAGCTVWDAAGKPYLDLLAGTWCNVLGYGHPRWVAAVQSQVSKLAHVGAAFSADEVEEALVKLRETLPPALDRAVLLNTGSEAVELALKMARAATGADGVAVIEQGYYGATTYALALSETGRAASYLPHLGHVLRLPVPMCRRCPMGLSWPCDGFPCLDALADAEPGHVVAVIYEPVLGAGGIIVPPPGYGTRLRDLATHCGALLIAEEVTTGMGRTGRWFAFEHDAIVPDILVIGKAIGAGLPVSAVVTTGEVEARCQGVLRHVQSHQNDPFSWRIAAAVIAILQEEGLVEQAAGRGAYLLDGLRELQSRCAWIWDVRGQGLMAGVELEPDRAAQGVTVRQRLLDSGFIVDYQPHTATLRLFPPYIIAASEIDRFLTAFEETLFDVGKASPV